MLTQLEQARRTRGGADSIVGRTGNREAATKLFLSPKTVEFHLGRLYKLAVTSRIGLEQRFAELDSGSSLEER